MWWDMKLQIKAAYCGGHCIGMLIATSQPEKYKHFELPIHDYAERIMFTKIEEPSA